MITPISKSDIPIVCQLARAIWPICYAEILSPEQIENILSHIYTEDNINAEVTAGHRFWLAHNDGKAVGYTSGYKENNIIWLKKLYVLPGMQGKGMGKRLAAAVIESFKPAKEVRLLVNSNNTAAQSFYDKTGFIRIEEVPVQMGSFSFTDFVYSKPLS